MPQYNFIEISDAHLDGHRNITFTNLKQRLDRDSKEIQEIAGKIGNKTLNDLITEKNTSYTEAINEVKTDTINLDNDIANIEGDISTLQENMTTINGTITALNENITSIETDKIDKVASATANRLPRFSSATGDLKSSGVSVDDNDNLSANTFKSTVADGTAPIQVASTTKVSNFNADKLDGYEATDFLRVAQVVASLGVSGYFKLPNSDESSKPIIVQWGTATTGTAAAGVGVYAANTPVTNFSIYFPTACVFAGAFQGATSGAWVSGIATTLNTIQVYLSSSTTATTEASNKTVKWFAVGY